MEPGALVIGGLIGFAILFVALALSGTVSEAEMEARIARYAKRVQADEGDTTMPFDIAQALSGSRALTSINKLVEQRDFGANLARSIARADLHLKVSEFLIIWAAIVVATPLLLVLLSVAVPNLRSPLALIVGVIMGAMAPRFWLRRRERSRLGAFNNQLADTVTLIANALRAGSSFLQACELVTREQTPPISTEFNRLIREVNMGLPFEQALENTVRRVRSDDLELLATAISIQYQVGGNLAEVLDSIAFTIRERVRIKGEIRTLTAQQRLSGLVVGFLPIGIGAFLFLLLPKFMAPMFANPPSLIGLPLGLVLLAIGGLMMAFGFFAIRRIVDIDI